MIHHCIADRLPEQETLTMAFTGLIRLRKRPYVGRPNTQRSPGRPRRSFLPRLERLEDRTVPSRLTVLNTLDSGAGSLRDAINHASSGETIVFAPSLDGQSISLTSGALAISKSLDIEGPGASLLAISGNDASRVFEISTNQPLGSIAVTIANLTITHGKGNGMDEGGGGILNVSSALTVAHDVFSYNRAVGGSPDNAAPGGAIDNRETAPNANGSGVGPPLSIIDCLFTGNQAIARNGGLGQGGALLNGGTTLIIGSTFTDNQSMGSDGGKVDNHIGPFIGTGEGGAIHNDSVLTIVDSTFTGNRAMGGSGGVGVKPFSLYGVDYAEGGVIFNDGAGTLTVSGSTFVDNEAIGGSNATGADGGLGFFGMAQGGAIDNLNVATITNCTFDHNKAQGGSGNRAGTGANLFGVGAGEGGAIDNLATATDGYIGSGTLTVSNCNFTANQAVGGMGNSGFEAGDAFGGGVSNGLSAAATISTSTFTGNQAIGAAGAVGGNGADARGGGIANSLGATLTLSNCTLTNNQAVGGAGGAGSNGGNGFGGGVFNDGPSSAPYAGTPPTLTALGSTITDDQATGGAAGSGGSAGQGVGGGAYFAAGGTVCLDAYTLANLLGNTASTSNNDIFGSYTIC
jgi:hypothetical protein